MAKYEVGDFVKFRESGELHTGRIESIFHSHVGPGYLGPIYKVTVGDRTACLYEVEIEGLVDNPKTLELLRQLVELIEFEMSQLSTLSAYRINRIESQLEEMRALLKEI